MRFFKLTVIVAVVIMLASCTAAKRARVRENRINSVISTAKGYVGTPYRWGGTTRAGMDCSGLLCSSFSTVGYDLPRTSEDQSKIGKKIKRNDIKPGDLVFFATGKKKREITHVGLVTEVRGKDVKFIHSSSSLGVVISSLDTRYYKERFRAARRPF